MTLPFKLLFVCSLLFSVRLYAQQPLAGPLQSGDLLFQDLDCGALCDAIEAVTESYGGRHFSHIGMVSIEGDSVFVIEAIGKEVQRSPLAYFTGRNKKELLLGRVRKPYRKIVPAAVRFAREQLGVPYDDVFLYNNGKYYCSELLYDAFKAANGGRDFFELQPMTFKQPGSNDYFPVWITYYEQLKQAIPEAMPGINPGGISTSGKIDVFIYRN